MNITLSQILDLVGKLDDTPGAETARERFRNFLRDNVKEVGQARDYIDECLRNSGDQYYRALQDLINHLGHFLGFDVTFGRYAGIPKQIGFDGLWTSPKRFSIVVEVKTTDTFAIKAATLVGYVDALISEKSIPNWAEAIGLYVVGRPDPNLHQLENAIIAEKRTDQLRIISVDSLRSLAEMMNERDMQHDDILALLRPSGPRIDPVVDLMKRLTTPSTSEVPEPPLPEPITSPQLPPLEETPASYWLTPVKSDETESAEECVQRLIGKEHIYAFGDRTPGRRSMKPGDRICFYATTNGVIAHATIVVAPERTPDSRTRHPEQYPWVCKLTDAAIYPDRPVVIDADIRSQLKAFVGRDPNNSWAWFVQATHKVTDHDFHILTRS